jgi:hypothetical protein
VWQATFRSDRDTLSVIARRELGDSTKCMKIFGAADGPHVGVELDVCLAMRPGASRIMGARADLND